MKKLMIACVLGLSGMLVGCDLKCENAPDINNNWLIHGRGVSTKEITRNGHEYIIISCGSCCNIIHSKSCSCGK